MRKQIKIERFKTTKDSNGNNISALEWTKYLWADVKRIGGGRTTSGGQTVLNNSIEFKIYYRPDVWQTGNYRIVYEGKRYTPQSIVKDEEKRFFWTILAEAV